MNSCNHVLQHLLQLRRAIEAKEETIAQSGYICPMEATGGRPRFVLSISYGLVTF